MLGTLRRSATLRARPDTKSRACVGSLRSGSRRRSGSRAANTFGTPHREVRVISSPPSFLIPLSICGKHLRVCGTTSGSCQNRNLAHPLSRDERACTICRNHRTCGGEGSPTTGTFLDVSLGGGYQSQFTPQVCVKHLNCVGAESLGVGGAIER